MRGLMAATNVKSWNCRLHLTCRETFRLEMFISTHGARKEWTDTALKKLRLSIVVSNVRKMLSL